MQVSPLMLLREVCCFKKLNLTPYIIKSIIYFIVNDFASQF